MYKSLTKIPATIVIISLSVAFSLFQFATTSCQRPFELDFLDSARLENQSDKRFFSSTYSTGIYDVDEEFLAYLCDSLDVRFDYNGMCSIIEMLLLPLNAHLLGVHNSGWENHANTTFSDITFQLWLDELLLACDRYGINVVFWLPHEWSAFSNWDTEVLAQFPELETLNTLGEKPVANDVSHLIIDHPLLLEQFKEDLKQLYDQYGHHTSWIGIGAFYGDQAHYAEVSGLECTNTGFHPYTIENFANSELFLKDINATGFHVYYKNGTNVPPEERTECKIWKVFVDDGQLIKLRSGLFNNYDPNEVYGGTEENAHVFMVGFRAPKQLDAFKIKWYGYRNGTPSDLHIELYRDRSPYDIGEFPEDIGSPLETVIQKGENTSTFASWQSEVDFNATLTEGDYYWLTFHAQGDSKNCYFIFDRDFRTDQTVVQSSIDGYLGPWQRKAGAIIWIKDREGNDVMICPLQGFRVVTNSSPLSFDLVAPRNMAFNTLIFFVADRQYDDRDTIVRVNSANGTTLASGLLSMHNMKGIYLWGVHVPLDRRTTIVEGEKYEIFIEGAPSFDSFFQLGYISTDPPQAGFQGNGECPLFALADMQLVKELQNYDHWSSVPIGADPITDSGWAAVRIMPSTDAQLQNVSVKIAEKYDYPSDFGIELRDDYDGTGQRPGTESLERVTYPERNITGPGWIDTAGWSYHLKADTYYWIVFRMAAPAFGGYKLHAKTNPYLYRLMYTGNGGQTWERGFPKTATPGEPIFRIETEAEVFKCEPEELNSYRIGGPALNDGKEMVAQSFSSSTDVIVRGVQVWISKKGTGFSDLIAEIREDNGTDEPSSTVVASTVSGADEYSYKGMVLFDFKFPVTIKARMKYWLVVRSRTAGVTTILSMYREPEYSYGGTSYEAKISNDGGQTWRLFQGKESDILFSFVKSPVQEDHMSFQSLVDDITTYHMHNVNDEPLWGWNSYLNLQASNLLKAVAEWLEHYTGKRLIVLDVNPTSILSEADEEQQYLWLSNPLSGSVTASTLNNSAIYKNVEENLKAKLKWPNILPIGNLGHTSSIDGDITPEQIRSYHLLTTPLLTSRFTMFQVSEDKIVDGDQQRWSHDFGAKLNRIRYLGDSYGKEVKEVKALFIGDSNIGTTIQFLTPSIDVTLCGFEGINGDYNLTRYGNFSEFDVIIWWSTSPSMDEIHSSAIDRIKTFVQNRGGLVVIGPWADWTNEILGLDCSGETIDPGDMDFVNYSHPIIYPFTDVSEYSYHAKNLKIVPLSFEVSYIVNDTKGQPWISANNYGSGRGVFCGSTETQPGRIGTSSNVYGAPRDSFLVLLNNALFYAAGRDSMIPSWWYEDTYKAQHAWHQELRYSISGKQGSPILLWISNNNETTQFEINLNTDFYGIDPNDWLAFDLESWKILTRGSGKNVRINVTIPAKSWMPIYITNLSSDSDAETLQTGITLNDVSSVISSKTTAALIIPTLSSKRRRSIYRLQRL